MPLLQVLGAVCQKMIVALDDTVQYYIQICIFSVLYWWFQLCVSVLAPKSVCCFSMLPLSLIPTLFYLCLFAVLLDSRTAYCFYCRMQWRVLLSPFACRSKVRMETNGDTVQWWTGCSEPGNTHLVHVSQQSILLLLETILKGFLKR